MMLRMLEYATRVYRLFGRFPARIAVLEGSDRELAFQQLITLAGLRRLASCVEQEASNIPILNDKMDHEVIGRERRRGIEIGRQEGQQEGELKLLCRQIEKRFGPIPAEAADALRGKSVAGLEELGLRLLDATCLDDLLL